MTPIEATNLARYVKACCPQQVIDDYTYDAWHDLLGDLSLEDCRMAVQTVANQQPFCAPSEIRAEVRRIRDKRLQDTEVPPPPPELLDNPAAYCAALHAAALAIADGRDPEPAMRAVSRQVRRELEAS